MVPVQPYYVLCANKYYKHIEMKNGIAHIYQYDCTNSSNGQILAVPDDSIDVFFDVTDEDSFYCLACGPVPKVIGTPSEVGHKYFGIRFLPGVKPAFLSGKFTDFYNINVDLTECMDSSYKEELKVFESNLMSLSRKNDETSSLSNFNKRTSLFIDFYNQILSRTITKSKGQDNFLSIYHLIHSMILDSKGLINVQEIEMKTGYSAQYIRRIMRNNFGCSPKELSDIVRLQNAFLCLDNDHKDMKISDIALLSGYFDQSHFDHIFKTQVGESPMEYRKRIKENKYQDRFIYS